MTRRTVLTGMLLATLVACGDTDPVGESRATPAFVKAVTDTTPDTAGAAELVALKDSAAALVERSDRPVSTVCARRVAELRKVRGDMAKKPETRSLNTLRSRELMLSAVISDACY